MAEVSHTHPHADRGAVVNPFQRGPIVAADGGERERSERERRQTQSAGSERNAAPPESDDETDEEEEKSNARMKDVNHEPPYGEGVDRVFERGGKEEPVESEE